MIFSNVSGEIGWLLKRISRLCLQFVDDVFLGAEQQALLLACNLNTQF